MVNELARVIQPQANTPTQRVVEDRSPGRVMCSVGTHSGFAVVRQELVGQGHRHDATVEVEFLIEIPIFLPPVAVGPTFKLRSLLTERELAACGVLIIADCATTVGTSPKIQHR